MEELILPEPGRTLFQRTAKLLIRGCGLGETDARSPRAVFGGGTVLAARWQHRASKDIDIQFPYQEAEGVLSRLRRAPVMEETWNRWLREGGLTPLQWITAYKARSQLTGQQELADPELELAEFAAPLANDTYVAKVEGLNIWVAGTAGILAGKWEGRRDEPPLRDLYDIAVAGEQDGLALQRALQCKGEHGTVDDFLELVQSKRDRKRHSDERAARLEGVPDKYVKYARNAAWWAGTAVARWAMTELVIERGAQGWEVWTKCEGLPEGFKWWETSDLDAAAQAAQEIGQLDRDAVTQLRNRAGSEGGATQGGAGAGRQRTMSRSIVVDGNGAVRITENEQVIGRTATIAQAADLGIETGIWNEAEREEVTQRMEVTMQQARSRSISD